jgi:hypothetical protein
VLHSLRFGCGCGNAGRQWQEQTNVYGGTAELQFLICCAATTLVPVCAAIRDPEEAWERHIEDSLAILPVIEQYAGSSSSSSIDRLSVIDVGTGAGLPGMVLAVVRPEWQVGGPGAGGGGRSADVCIC